MSLKDIMEYVERFLNKISNPLAIVAFILAALTFTIYHPLNKAIEANTQADITLSNNFYMSTMYDVLKQGEKMEGDSIDIKKADMYKLVSLCEDQGFNDYLNQEPPVRMKLETKHICKVINSESMKESVITHK